MGKGSSATKAQGNVTAFTPVEGPSAWYAADYKDNDTWIYRLTDSDIQEIEDAVDAVKATKKDIKEISREEFPLPSLGPKLESFRDEVVLGRGFYLIKGLPVERLGVEASVTAYWGFSLYWGTAVSQNAKGHLIGHVKDVGLDPKNIVNRVYQTKGAQPWHCDSADVVGLLCLRTAKSGGMSSWSSSVTVHNELLKTNPQHVNTFVEEWFVDRKNEVPEGKLPYFKLPVMNYHEGYLSTFYEPSFFHSVQRHPDVPKLSPQQLEALSAFDELASSPELRMDYWLEPGDIQLLSNHQVVHTRTGYEDWGPESEKKRHLLRLWVSPPNDRPLPPIYADRYGSVEIGKRGGIIVPGYVHNTISFDAELVRLPGHELA